MTNEDVLNRRYFDWIYQKVFDAKYLKNESYRNLLSKLFDESFTCLLPMDDNRAMDGIDLRYRFGREKNYSDALIASHLDTRPCSILEMMVALAIRCEEHIMEDDEFGDRTGQWFWNMIVSLGLGGMDDRHYDEERADRIIDRFLNREYDRNGKGGLFTVYDCPKDMRDIEIWYQMHLYLDEFI